MPKHTWFGLLIHFINRNNLYLFSQDFDYYYYYLRKEKKKKKFMRLVFVRYINAK